MIKHCPAGPLSWIGVRQMRDVDRVAIELGLTLTRMMENAGANLAWLASAMLGGDVRAAGSRSSQDQAGTVEVALSLPAG